MSRWFPLRGRLALIAPWLVLAAAGTGCNEGGGSVSSGPAETSTAGTSTITDTVDPAPPPPAAEVPEIECPPGLADCVTAGGEVLYVERVDPDGDGDAHFVLLSREGITAPGISVLDVRADLRPDPLPRRGDLIAGAGPVFEGSYGQRQIQAEVIAVKRR